MLDIVSLYTLGHLSRRECHELEHAKDLGYTSVAWIHDRYYNYWKLCMKAYLRGQDLCDLIEGDDTKILADTPQNAKLHRKWKIECVKALFTSRTLISKEYINHVRDLKSPKQVWETLQKLFTKKNTARLQFLENELAVVTQGNFSVEEYFLK